MKRTIAFATVILFSLSTTALAAETIKNWSAPSTWTPPSAQATGRSALVTYPPLPFIPVTPCRVADTRGNGFTGTYGPPFMAGGVPRNFTITGQCGIPAGAQAVSFNFTVTNTAGTGFLLVFPQGGAQPNVSTLNYVASQTIANAAVVPLGSGGLTAIPGVSGFDLLIDVNGYYTTNVGTSTFVISSTGGYGIIGVSTTNVGVWGMGPTAGVFGQDSGSAGKGVYGLSSTGLGVYGLSSTNSGVKGVTGGVNPVGTDYPAGVAGESPSGFGVFAKTNTGCSMIAYRENTSGAQNEVDLGCNDAYSARFWGAVFVNGSLAGGPGNLSVAGNLTKASGSFKIDHPLDPENKYLYHSFVESPDMKNVYDGVVELNSRGEAVVVLPNYFEALNSDFRYQLTSIGRHAPIFIADEVGGNQFRIAGGRPGMRVSWQVTGIRKDAWANAHRIVPEVEKEPEMQGRYLHPVELGKSISKGPSEMPQSRVVQETQQ